MNKIIVVHHYYSVVINGVYTSMIDLYTNLSKYMDVQFKLVLRSKNNRYQEFFRKSHRQLFYKSFNHLSQLNFLSVLETKEHIDADTIICSSSFLVDNIRHNLGITLNANNIIVLDSLDMHMMQFNSIPRHYKIANEMANEIYCDNLYDDFTNVASMSKIKNTVDTFATQITDKKYKLLANPANLGIFNCDEYEYYHKFSRRLEKISYLFKQDLDYSRNSEYTRSGNTYIENIGKSIFESIYHGYAVNYKCIPNQIKDGLYYYLKLFEINGLENHCPLPITKDDIIDKLFFKDTDLVLSLIDS